MFLISLSTFPVHPNLCFTTSSYKSMATGISATLNSTMSCRLGRSSFTLSNLSSFRCSTTPVTHLKGDISPLRRIRRSLRVCLVVDKKIQHGVEIDKNVDSEESSNRASERLARKKVERYTYLVAAMMSSFGITSMAVVAVYYRFSWQMEGGEIPVMEMFGTFALSVGAAVGMEFWARWAHRALWHASLWHMHESHHRPREGPFELNDVFAIINAAPAISLLSYGFFNKGLVPGLCFGAGLGITVFGMAYMFVHDGLVHRRFPVGPIADVPYLRKVAAAHQLHHSDKFNGVPFGLFLGPKEVEEVGKGDQ